MVILDGSYQKISFHYLLVQMNPYSSQNHFFTRVKHSKPCDLSPCLLKRSKFLRFQTKVAETNISIISVKKIGNVYLYLSDIFYKYILLLECGTSTSQNLN